MVAYYETEYLNLLSVSLFVKKRKIFCENSATSLVDSTGLKKQPAHARLLMLKQSAWFEKWADKREEDW